MTTTPRKEHAKDLVEALKDQGDALAGLKDSLLALKALQDRHILELETLSLKQAKEWEETFGKKAKTVGACDCGVELYVGMTFTFDGFDDGEAILCTRCDKVEEYMPDRGCDD